jgi:hypothetical protein
MKVQVYKCRFTGTIFGFEDKPKYIKHLKKLRDEMKEQREYAKLRREFSTWLAAEKEKIVSIDMLTPWIQKNQKYLMKVFNTPGCSSWSVKDKWYPETDEIVEIKFDVRYSDHVSNSHSCPHNGVTNWGARNKNAPTGYPGFTGRVAGKTKRDKKHINHYPTGDLLKMIGIRPGTGGGGNKGWGWSTELFLADWPGLSQQVLVEKLQGK